MQMTRHQDNWSPLREFEDLSSRMSRLFGLTKWPGNGEHETLTRRRSMRRSGTAS
jgi:hypothetical protein